MSRPEFKVYFLISLDVLLSSFYYLANSMFGLVETGSLSKDFEVVREKYDQSEVLLCPVKMRSFGKGDPTPL